MQLHQRMASLSELVRGAALELISIDQELRALRSGLPMPVQARPEPSKDARPETLPIRLRKAREEMGWTQGELEQRIKCSAGEVSRRENGVKRITQEFKERIERAIGRPL